MAKYSLGRGAGSARQTSEASHGTTASNCFQVTLLSYYKKLRFAKHGANKMAVARLFENSL
jgi:hypothetical protein